MASLVAIARALGMPVVLHILFAWAQWVIFLAVVLRCMMNPELGFGLAGWKIAGFVAVGVGSGSQRPAIVPGTSS